MQNNKYYKNYEENDKLIVGKSDINKEEFDTLVFACRDIKTISILSNIKKISSFAFTESSLESIYIPSYVKEIGLFAFGECSNLRHIEFSPNSELKIIDEFLFAESSIYHKLQ